MKDQKRNLIIIGIIAFINALGYGIIIPIIYTYSRKFGLNDFQNGLLFALFSICQFLATPVIGKLSDKYGRRPLLILSIAGTAVSFFMAAFAPSAFFLYLARALDGITAGNIPVASAVISDSTDHTNRAKGFGIIGASFGFGMFFGPIISGLTLGFGMNVPFIIAGIITIIATIATAIMLPETNKHIGQQIDLKHVFNFSKLYSSLFDKKIGLTLIIILLYSLAFGLFIFAFQPLSVKVLKFSPQTISAIFTMFGLIGFVTQAYAVHKLVKKFGETKILTFMIAVATLGFFEFYLVTQHVYFIIACVAFSFANSIINPLLTTILSKEVDAKSQGEIMGLSSSYVSLGTIFGPIIGGLLSNYSVPLPFLLGTGICLVCLVIAYKIMKDVHFVRQNAPFETPTLENEL
jgi:MFS family permease